MHKILIGLVICLMVFCVGCTTIETIAPSQLDEAGNVIPGTHQLNPTAQAVAENLGVWGQAAAAVPLLIWNFVEMAKAKKDQKGLMATIKALRLASTDPKTKASFDKIKEYLKNAHDVAGVSARINALLAKL